MFWTAMPANDTPYSPHAYMDARQFAYEKARRAFQEAMGRPIKRMSGNGRGDHENDKRAATPAKE